MGHQILCQALGGKTYKLKFGHRGSNHPIQDDLLKRVYISSQNHGYNVDLQSLPKGVKVTHINLNDKTVAGIAHDEKKCFSVQFHPESHPGPHDAQGLFDYFVKQIT
jgi:carbamoyl-phosphate synthase small subunit